jgi:DNA (cytosine-5)-methyltransferase 1
MVKSQQKKNAKTYKVVDLFCGIGGLSHGFIKEDFNVVAGYDLDSSCKYAFETNNNSIFYEKDIAHVSKAELQKHYANSKVKILVGCAPPPGVVSKTTRTGRKSPDLLTIILQRQNYIEILPYLINTISPLSVSASPKYLYRTR